MEDKQIEILDNKICLYVTCFKTLQSDTFVTLLRPELLSSYFGFIPCFNESIHARNAQITQYNGDDTLQFLMASLNLQKCSKWEKFTPKGQVFIILEIVSEFLEVWYMSQDLLE